MLSNKLYVRNYRKASNVGEFLLEKGAIDMIVKRSEMRSTLGNLLSKLTNQPSPFVEVEVVENA